MQQVGHLFASSQPRLDPQHPIWFPEFSRSDCWMQKQDKFLSTTRCGQNKNFNILTIHLYIVSIFMLIHRNSHKHEHTHHIFWQYFLMVTKLAAFLAKHTLWSRERRGHYYLPYDVSNIKNKLNMNWTWLPSHTLSDKSILSYMYI